MTSDINSEVNKVSFMDVGIHENVELKNVRSEVSKNGNPFLAFDFEDSKGRTLSHTEWPITNNVTAERVQNQMKRVRHIVVKFIPEEKYIFEAKDFTDFANKTVALLGEAYKGKKVRVKVVYNNNDFTDLPNYTPFIESMDIPTNESKLEIISIDKVKKSVTPDTNTGGANPFASADEGTTDSSAPQDAPKDDLPF
jgi:hypothetical protein